MDVGAEPKDWIKWHADYDDPASELSRRLEVVQRHIRSFLEDFEGSPVRVVSMCAGDARDLLGAIAALERRDVTGRLVELNPLLADRARSDARELGLPDLEIATGDAGELAAYQCCVPADLVLVCGVFGNISDDDIQTTIAALPMLAATGATVVWTRGRRKPDITPRIRQWLADAGFAEVAFEPVSDSEASVGVARFRGDPRPLIDRKLFTFIRTG